MFKEGALMTRVNDGFGTIAHRTSQVQEQGEVLRRWSYAFQWCLSFIRIIFKFKTIVLCPQLYCVMCKSTSTVVNTID